ncbi:MAG: ABC transporter permease [Gemmatimonadota bacterium]
MIGIVRFLVRLLPRPFREEFGDEVVAQAETELTRARAVSGSALWRAYVTTVADLVWSNIAERWRPSWFGRTGVVFTGGGEGMEQWIRDLRWAARSLRSSGGFAVTVVMVLGLAIGVNTAIFAVVDEVLLNPLEVEEPGRLVHITASAPGSGLPDEFGSSAELYLQYSELDDLFESVATYNWFTATFRTPDRTERVPMSAPTPSLFRMLGAEPALGRLPVADDEGMAVVLSHSAFQDWFGGDERILGRSYEIMGDSRSIVGVMPEGFGFPNERVLLWIPEEIRDDGDLEVGRFGVNVAARLRPGISMDAVPPRLEAAARLVTERYDVSANYERLLLEQHRAIVRPLADEIMGDVATPARIMLGAVLIVLLIACANVTNLLMVRAERRQGDFAVRSAIGAGRNDLARAQLAEVSLLAAAAGAVAVGVAWVSLPALVSAAPPNTPGLSGASIGVGALAATFVLSVASAFLCGALPTLRSAATTAVGVGSAGRGVSRRSRWGRDGLVVLQTAMALVLLVGSGLLMRSFQQLRAVDPGYDVDEVFTFQIAIEDEPGMEMGTDFARFHLDFMDQLRALPQVERVGLVNNVPLDEGVGSTRFVAEGDIAEDAGSQLGRTWVGGDYFDVMGIALLEGRAFDERDHLENPGFAILSRTAAQLLFPGEDPIGRRFTWPEGESIETVIGVVEDVMQYSYRDEVQPLVYLPMVLQWDEEWGLSSPAYVVKSPRAADLAPEVRELARAAAPTAPMYSVFTMQGLAADSMVSLSFALLVLGVASALALMLGTVGLYGVLSYVVAQRSREIGVRMALGAEAERVQRMVVTRGMRVVALGVGIGLVVAWLSAETLSALLFEVQSADATTFAVVSAALVAVGMLASYVPARRASLIDPVETLRDG